MIAVGWPWVGGVFTETPALVATPANQTVITVSLSDTRLLGPYSGFRHR